MQEICSKRRLIRITMLLVLLSSLCFVVDCSFGKKDVFMGEPSNTFNIEEGAVYITEPGEYYVYGTGVETDNRIVVETQGTVYLTIENINCVDILNPSIENSEGDMVLIVEGENFLKKGILNSGNSLCIKGEGILNVYSAIRSDENKLIIDSSTINVSVGIGDRHAHYYSAVIGAGRGQNAGEIVINGGIINIDIGLPAEEGSYVYETVGIGSYNYCESITINGGTINIEDGLYACVGGGDCGTIEINNGNININTVYNVGIGAANTCENIVINGGNIDINSKVGYCGIGAYESCKNVVIKDGNINVVVGHSGGCAIGSNNCNKIEIWDGEIFSYGGAAGIGARYELGTITIYDGDIKAYAKSGPGIGVDEKGDAITIYDGTIEAYGGESSAAIGCGSSNSTGQAKINNIKICGGQIKAYGSVGGNNNWQGAAIGGGGYCIIGGIDILGGEIYAEGSDHAAAIGSGMAGTCTRINIAGGKITAIGGSYSAAIGSGSYNAIDGGLEGKPQIKLVKITGGEIYIRDRKYASTGIGIGSGYMEDSPKIKVLGGTIVIEPSPMGYSDIGSPQGIKEGTVEITGGSIYAKNLDEEVIGLERRVINVGEALCESLVTDINLNNYGLNDVYVNNYGTVEFFVPSNTLCIVVTINGEQYQTHIFNEWKQIVTPTCIREGEERRYCKHCDYYEMRESDMIDHTYVSTIISPTIDAEGYTHHECRVCGDSYNDDFVEKLEYILADVNGDKALNSDDAIYLLKYSLFPELYPVNQSTDFDGDGLENSDDAIYLLKHTLFPEMYPIHKVLNADTCSICGVEKVGFDRMVDVQNCNKDEFIKDNNTIKTKETEDEKNTNNDSMLLCCDYVIYHSKRGTKCHC